MRKRHIVMIGPSPTALGGVAAVARVYQESELFRRWPVIYLATYVEGSKWRKLAAALVALGRFATLLAGRRVMLLHAHAGGRSSLWRKTPFFMLAYATACPVIFHLHDGGFSEFYWDECGPIKKRLVRYILRRAARIVALSSRWLELVSRITENQNLVKIPNAIAPFPDVNIARPREPATLLFLGWLIPEKGVFDLLEAVARLRVLRPDLRVLFGGNRGAEEILRKTRDLGIEEHVRLLGWVTGDDKQRLLREATLFVLPSYREGMPMTVLEAMAAGLPVVATNVGGIPDAVSDGVEGCLIAPGDVDALTQVIATLLEDSALRETMGRAGQAKVAAEFSVDSALPKVEALYRDLGGRPIPEGEISLSGRY
jgi:glycosyltransferase involved in cell wall biosynthesis